MGKVCQVSFFPHPQFAGHFTAFICESFLLDNALTLNNLSFSFPFMNTRKETHSNPHPQITLTKRQEGQFLRIAS